MEIFELFLQTLNLLDRVVLEHVDSVVRPAELGQHTIDSLLARWRLHPLASDTSAGYIGLLLLLVADCHRLRLRLRLILALDVQLTLLLDALQIGQQRLLLLLIVELGQHGDLRALSSDAQSA